MTIKNVESIFDTYKYIKYKIFSVDPHLFYSVSLIILNMEIEPAALCGSLFFRVHDFSNFRT